MITTTAHKCLYLKKEEDERKHNSLPLGRATPGQFDATIILEVVSQCFFNVQFYHIVDGFYGKKNPNF